MKREIVSNISSGIVGTGRFFAWKVSAFGVILVCIFPHSDWIQRDKDCRHCQVHCVNTVHIRNYFGPHFPAFGLSTERYSVSIRIQSKCWKMQTRITPNTDNSYAVFTAAIRLQRKHLLWNVQILLKQAKVYLRPCQILMMEFF